MDLLHQKLTVFQAVLGNDTRENRERYRLAKKHLPKGNPPHSKPVVA